MTKLWTLREIEKDFLDVKPDGNFMVCINACRRNAKKWYDSILKNFKKNHCKFKYNELLDALEAVDITFDALCADKAHLITDHDVIYAMSKLNFIKHFFNLE